MMDGYEKHLSDHLEGPLALPPAAVSWLIDLWRVIQLFDDVADGDAVARPDLDRAIWAALVGMPGNEFFMAKAGALLPVMATQILKWQASDKAERAGKADAKSYMWRAGFYDVVMLVVHLCHGQETAVSVAATAMALYGETYEDYQAEFAHA